MKPNVVILMGSKADLAHAQKIAEACAILGLETTLRIGSAHKTPAHVLALLNAYEEDPHPKVYITVAGLSNGLSGFVDGAVSSPVIACPPIGEAYGGVDIIHPYECPQASPLAWFWNPAMPPYWPPRLSVCPIRS